MLKINDVVRDAGGVLRIVVDGNKFDGGDVLEYNDNFGGGVIFMDIDYDAGIW